MLHKPEALIDREDNICHKTGFSLHERKMPRKKIMQKRKEKVILHIYAITKK